MFKLTNHSSKVILHRFLWHVDRLKPKVLSARNRLCMPQSFPWWGVWGSPRQLMAQPALGPDLLPLPGLGRAVGVPSLCPWVLFWLVCIGTAGETLGQQLSIACQWVTQSGLLGSPRNSLWTSWWGWLSGMTSALGSSWGLIGTCWLGSPLRNLDTALISHNTVVTV